MNKLLSALLASGMLNALLPAAAAAQEEQQQTWSDLGIGEPDQTPPPEAPPPAELPPAPQYAPQYDGQVQAEAPAPPPQAQAQPAPSTSAAGQWIYTQQYGWIWMPYGDAYTYSPSNGYGEPVAYVYYPAHSCWAWVAAPWVWGIGPWPFFGVFGPAHFGWYGHGWWRYPSHWHYAPFRGTYAGFRPSPFRGGGFARPAPARGGFVRPAPARGGFVRPAPAPAFRGGVGFGGAR
ncbi:MAG TPA: hypothetical protein VFK90_11785, partial [Anaeromyxobacter sp.]|nr:hypothetical protein [Anaeromyxobacter sp.]